MASPDHKVRVFLSYARGDDEPFVRRLHDDLTAAGFTVWFDRDSLMSRGLTFHQEIRDAIRCEVDRIVYVGGPKAALSPYVKEEWQLGLQFDHVVVTPILRLGDYPEIPGELGLLHCEDFRDDTNYDASLANLVTHLIQPNPKLGALLGVPDLPPHFLARPELMRRVKDALLVDLQTAQVITSADSSVGVQGMGGIGKSVLAVALARNREVRQSYPDGIVWISFGQNLTRDDLLSRLRELVRHLSGEAVFQSIPEGQSVLREQMQDKAVLLVLDDVWRASDAKAFDHLGPRCRMLVTTRDAGILHTLHGQLVPVSLLTMAEAMQLLADAVGLEVSALPAEAREVGKECGLLPLALALSGGMAKKRGGNFHSVLERLRRADLDKIADRESINDQHRSIWRAMQASVEMLDEAEQRRFAELAVFSTDETVPEETVATLWDHTGNLDDLDTEELLINLGECSLIQLDQKPDSDGRIQRRVSLHDLLHDYATRIAGEPRALHQTLLDAYRKCCPDGWASGPDDGYFFQRLITHLIRCEVGLDAEEVLTRFHWPMRKCELGLLDSLLGDYEHLAETGAAKVSRAIKTWHTFFLERSHILRRGNSEWGIDKILFQIAMDSDQRSVNEAAVEFLRQGRCEWFWLRRTGRPPRGASRGRRVLEGHTSVVIGALELRNGNILSWSADCSLRVWDKISGKPTAVLVGHTTKVKGAIELPGHRILSWGTSLRVWDLDSCRMLLRMEDSNGVDHVFALPSGLIVSAGKYFTERPAVRLWNWETGVMVASFAGPGTYLWYARLLADGRLFCRFGDESGFKSSYVRILRTSDLSLDASFDGEGSQCSSILELSNGGLLSKDGNFLTLRDGQSGQSVAFLRGHEENISGFVELPGLRVLSWSRDHTIRVWDLEQQSLMTVMRGTEPIRWAVLVDDARVMSFSSEGIVQVWNVDSGAEMAKLEGHTSSVRGVLKLSEEAIMSWSWDGTLKRWDVSAKAPTAVISSPDNGVAEGARLLSDGKILSWSQDKLMISDLSLSAFSPNGRSQAYVRDAVVVPNERMLSWEGAFGPCDCHLRFWDVKTGELVVARRIHHDDPEVLMLRGGRIVTTAKDRITKLWDQYTGDEIAVLSESVFWLWTSTLETSDGELLIRDGSVITRWDVECGLIVGQIDVPAPHVDGFKELPNGRLLAWSWEQCELWIFDKATGRVLATMQQAPEKVTDAFVAPDGRIISESWDNLLHLWDGEGQLVAVLRGHSKFVGGVSFISGNRILTRSSDGTIRIWSGDNGAPLKVLKGHSGTVEGALVLSDGGIISWSNSVGDALRLWNGDDGSLRYMLSGHSDSVRGAIELPERRGILSWSADSVRVWDIHTGEAVTVARRDDVWASDPWIAAILDNKMHPTRFHQGFVARDPVYNGSQFAELRFANRRSVVARWHAGSNCRVLCISASGAIFAVTDDNQAHVLHLYYGADRVSLKDCSTLVGAT